MPEFRIFETNEFSDRLKRLARSDAELIRRKLKKHVYPQLRREPFFGPNIKKLRGYSPDTWRYRIGKFRLFYVVDDNERILYVVSVDLRRDAYR